MISRCCLAQLTTVNIKYTHCTSTINAWLCTVYIDEIMLYTNLCSFLNTNHFIFVLNKILREKPIKYINCKFDATIDIKKDIKSMNDVSLF